jgi:hypothetical protein
MNNYKLKHLSKYCCKPANETEFEAVKMAAELGGVKWYDGNNMNWAWIGTSFHIVSRVVMFNVFPTGKTEISCLDFIKKLRMTESEAKELEDDMVTSCWTTPNYVYWNSDNSHLVANKGHYFRVSEDGLTVTLHKKEVK